MHYLFISLCISYVYWHVHATACLQRKRTSCWSWLSLSTILDSRDWIQVVRQGSNCLYLINHLFRLYFSFIELFYLFTLQMLPLLPSAPSGSSSSHPPSTLVLRGSSPPTLSLLVSKHCSCTRFVTSVSLLLCFLLKFILNFNNFISRNSFVEQQMNIR